MANLLNPYSAGGDFAWKGQTHCHSNNSDNFKNQPPREVVQAYKDKGYDFICLTDHSYGGLWPVPHLIGANYPAPDPQIPGIVYIASAEDGDQEPHHMLALGLDFEAVCAYHDHIDAGRDRNKNGIDDINNLSGSHIQQRIDYLALVQKALPVLAHPRVGHNRRGGYAFEEIQLSQRYTGLEFFSGGSWCLDWWQKTLRSGLYRQVWGFSGDDCHIALSSNTATFNRGWIVVNSERDPQAALDPAQLTPEHRQELQAHLLRQVKQGNFYAVVRSPELSANIPGSGPADLGPHLKVTSSAAPVQAFSGHFFLPHTLEVQTDLDSRLFFWGGRVGLEEETHPLLGQEHSEGASFPVGEEVDYVIVQVEQRRPDGETYWAFSQPVFHQKYFSLESFHRPGFYVHFTPDRRAGLLEVDFQARALPGSERRVQVDTLKYLERYDYRRASFRLVPGGLVGAEVEGGSLSFESVEQPGWYLTALEGGLALRQGGSPDDLEYKRLATFVLRPGLMYGNPNDPTWVSFEALARPGEYLYERDYSLALGWEAGEGDFRARATFHLANPLCAGIAWDAYG
jgi:hypothetical protein